MHLAQRQQRAGTARRTCRPGHLAIRIYNQKAAAALAGRLYKPLMKRIRGVAAHPFPQRGGKVPGLRGMGADRVGKQRVAD